MTQRAKGLLYWRNGGYPDRSGGGGVGGGGGGGSEEEVVVLQK